MPRESSGVNSFARQRLLCDIFGNTSIVKLRCTVAFIVVVLSTIKKSFKDQIAKQSSFVMMALNTSFCCLMVEYVCKYM